MGIGAGMFFLQALGGAGKKYSEIKAREKERQFLEQQAETQRTRDMEDWEKKQDILLAKAKAKERDDYLKEQRTFKNMLLKDYTEEQTNSLLTSGKLVIDDAISQAGKLNALGLDPKLAYKFEAIDGVPESIGGSLLKRDKEFFKQFQTADEDTSFTTYQALLVDNTRRTQEAMDSESPTEVILSLTKEREKIIKDSLELKKAEADMTEEKLEKFTFNKMKDWVHTSLNTAMGMPSKLGVDDTIELAIFGNTPESFAAQITTLEQLKKETEVEGSFFNTEVAQNYVRQRTEQLQSNIKLKAQLQLQTLESYKSKNETPVDHNWTSFNTDENTIRNKLHYIDIFKKQQNGEWANQNGSSLEKLTMNYAQEYLKLLDNDKDRKGYVFIVPYYSRSGRLDNNKQESQWYLPYIGSAPIRIQ